MKALKPKSEISTPARTLKDLMHLYLTNGENTVKEALQHYIAPESSSGCYSLINAGQGKQVVRTDVLEEDKIQYRSFDPPATWGAPYSILLAIFEPTPKPNIFMHHPGEELLFVLNGQVTYHFLRVHQDGREFVPKPEVLKPLSRGHAIRVQPQVPHHTWAAGKSTAEAFMVFASKALPSIVLDTGHSPRKKDESIRRRVKKEQLENLGSYALAAFGIAERLRFYRQQADLEVAELARACGIDPSYLLKIESARTNPSLSVLVLLANFLHIDLEDLILAGPSKLWNFQVSTIANVRAQKGSTKKPASFFEPIPELEHSLHPLLLRIPSREIVEGKIPCNESMTSWIVLDGTVRFHIDSGEKLIRNAVEEGGVMHVRSKDKKWTNVRIEALQDSKLAQVVFDRKECQCVTTKM